MRGRGVVLPEGSGIEGERVLNMAKNTKVNNSFPSLALWCAHCHLPLERTDPGVVRQWRLFVLPAPNPALFACSAVCEGEVRRMAYVLAGESGEREG
jgi:hypothetical protein